MTATNTKEKDTKEEKEKEKEKKEKTIFKYSRCGRGDLHEAVIIGDKPYFIKYVYDSSYEKKRVQIVEKIEENTRILLPPEREEYPYTPYTFDDEDQLNDFIKQAENITLDQVYQKAKNIYGGKKYIDQDPHIITLLPTDTIWTYFQDLFPFTHYAEGVGDNSVGKSTIGYVFEYTAYRAIRAVSISGANYYRILGSDEPGQCVIIEDEGDSISEDPDKIRTLKSGYEYSGHIPKTNMNTTSQKTNWFYTYCYKMILSEKSLSQSKARGLLDRTVSFHCRTGKVQYSIKEVASENINKNPDLQTLYDELLDFRKLMLCYRLVHYTDTLPEIQTGLVNRDSELFKPALQLFAKTEALQEIIPALEVFVNQRRERKLNSIESALYPIIKKQVYADLGKKFKEKKDYPRLVSVPLAMLWDDITVGGIEGHYDKNQRQRYETINFGVWHLNTISRIFKDKFGATIKRDSDGTKAIFDRLELDRLEEIYGQSEEAKINVKIIKDYEEYSGTGTTGESSGTSNYEGNEGYEGYEGYIKCVDNEDNANISNCDTYTSSSIQVETDLNNNTGTHLPEPSLPSLPSLPSYPCHWCPKIFPTKEAKTKHSVNSHPGKQEDPDPELLKLVQGEA